jgi:tetratricopeptide (TPR) repeat protein
MVTRACMLAVLVAVAGTAKLAALFVHPETRLVPIERLVANLERQIEAEPLNVQARINLGRLHAMAFALKVEEFPAFKGPANQEGPYYGPEAGPVPANIRPASSPEHAAAAARHLKESIRHYEAAIALAIDNAVAHLGLGWVLQQSGDAARAISEYRRVVELAWAKEEKIKMPMPGQRLLTQEAITHLLPLLDPAKDAAEIQDLKTKLQSMNARGRAITPIAIPLTDGVPPDDVLDPAARVRFDADGSGLDREWTWITAKVGWLVYDATGRGEIKSALQLFGNVTFWLFWSNGYEALHSLDDNDDGRLTGVELNNLAIWHDRNGNGISERSEVRSVSDHGMVALSCGYAEIDDGRFAAVSRDGVLLRDGRTRPTYDVILRHSAFTLTGVPVHQPTDRSFATEQRSMNAEKHAHATHARDNERLLWRSSEIRP